MSLTENLLWNPDVTLVLASQSMTRKHLLEACGIPFLALAADIDERQIEAEFTENGGAVVDLASALARAKALALSESDGRYCLGADQTLILDGQVFHKSPSRAAAEATLAQLSGRTHQLISAFAIAFSGSIVQEGRDIAELTMRALDPEQIALYLDYVGDGALDSVGGYQAEAAGVHLFREIRGAHSTVLGLPMLPLLAALRALGALKL